MLELVSHGRPAAGRRGAFADRRHHPPGHAGYPIDPKRVYVAGLSAGGAAAAIMAATHPDLYAAVGIHSGLACGAASDLPSAFVAMRQGGGSKIADGGSPVPTFFHGDRDTTVHPNNGDRIVEQSANASGLTAKVIDGRVPHGHAYTRTNLTDAGGCAISEHWNVHGAGHAWSGGSPAGSYTDPRGPDATREMLRFFLEHSLPGLVGLHKAQVVRHGAELPISLAAACVAARAIPAAAMAGPRPDLKLPA
jgi:poly(3-hydroxybutyrate) depolymerase